MGLSEVTIERQRGRKSPARQRPARGVVALHDAAGGVGVQRHVHDGLGLVASPATRMSVSMSCGTELQRLCRSGPGTRFCQVRATASSRSKPPANPMSSSPSGCWGRLPNSHWLSPQAHVTPASPSNSSRYAWPERLGSGLVNAYSALTSSRDGAAAALGDQLVQRAVDPARLEVELGIGPADQVGGRLEPEGRAGERTLLALVHPDQVDGAAIAERIPRGHAEDVGRAPRRRGPAPRSAPSPAPSRCRTAHRG